MNAQPKTQHSPTIEVYYSDVSCLRDPALFQNLYAKMNTERQKKIDRFRFDKDKCLSLGVGTLLEHAFELHEIEHAKIARGKFGKPYIESGNTRMFDPRADGSRVRDPCASESRTSDALAHDPIASISHALEAHTNAPRIDSSQTRDSPLLNFNLSHSGAVALCALSPCEIGCDVEFLADPPMNIAHRVFTPAEREVLNSQTGDEQTQNTQTATVRSLNAHVVDREALCTQKLQFYQFWTAKESILKMTGEGLSRDPRDFSIEAHNVFLHEQISSTNSHKPAHDSSFASQNVSHDSFSNPQVTIQNIDGCTCTLFTFLCDNEHIASLCVEGEHAVTEFLIKEIDLSAL